jgi:hypothetical protein
LNHFYIITEYTEPAYQQRSNLLDPFNVPI